MTQQELDRQEAVQAAEALTTNMLAATQPDAIFGQPVEIGQQTILTTSEVGAAMGVGRLLGVSGGGGTSSGRPVAVVTVTADSVQVRPVLDVTKLVLASFALLGTFLMMRRARQRRGC